MGFSPTFDTPDMTVIAEADVELVRPQGKQKELELLRFGGLTLNSMTGAAHWRGKALTLSVPERELLAELMRRAGQIVSRERLAITVGRGDVLDERMRDLKITLSAHGVTALPREVEGLGYILWRA
ncbi:MAG: hypothetical protein ACXWQ5_08195 [Ktedonobacterales bacterium]